MAGTKTIRSKIKSVQNTCKITRAMEMVAASKMRRAQQQMVEARPYAEKIAEVAARLGRSQLDHHHPLIAEHPTAKEVGVILITTDKGLCGGLNSNLFRLVLGRLRDFQAEKVSVHVSAIGAKGANFFKRFNTALVSQVDHLGDTVQLEHLLGTLHIQQSLYSEGRLRAVYLAYNRFINSMKQEPLFEPLLPLQADRLFGQTSKNPVEQDYLYEPDAQSVVNDLLRRYLEARVYQAVCDNKASEQAARMVAMKAATENGEELARGLRLVYNKSRQTAITQEIAEIVSGAAAL